MSLKTTQGEFELTSIIQVPEQGEWYIDEYGVIRCREVYSMTPHCERPCRILVRLDKTERFMRTGEYRKPCRGEWFESGQRQKPILCVCDNDLPAWILEKRLS